MIDDPQAPEIGFFFFFFPVAGQPEIRPPIRVDSQKHPWNQIDQGCFKLAKGVRE